MSQNIRNPPPVQAPEQCKRSPGGQRHRRKTAPTAPRGTGVVPVHAAVQGAPPPPTFQYQAVGRHSSRVLRSVSGVPPPPPYPPPQPHLPIQLAPSYFHGMMPQAPAPLEYQSGLPPLPRAFGYNYAPAPPLGMAALDASQPVYPGYPSAMPYSGGQLTPPGAETTGYGMSARMTAGSVTDRKVVGDNRPNLRSPRTPKKKSGKEARSKPAEGSTKEAVANSLGLPIRPGKPDCKHFLSRGWCSYGRVCKYNHPEVASTPIPPMPPIQPIANGNGMMQFTPGAWPSMGMPYTMYSWSVPQMPATNYGPPATEGAMYGQNWGYQPPSAVMCYPPTAPALPRADVRYPPNHSARSSDSTASTSSRLMDPDNVSEHKSGVGESSRP